MERLTTNTPKNNLQTALNLFYVKDGQAWVRGGGPEPDYKDCSLYDYIRETMVGVLDPVDVARMNIGQLTDEEIGAAMADWLMDGHCCIHGLIAHLYTAAWAFAEIRHRLSEYEDLELTPEEIEQQFKNFSSFLMEMTGGSMSKTNYTVQAMVSEANDHFESVCDECSDRQHLQELLKAEQEGRLIILDAPMVPVMEDSDPLSSDVFCPRCNENLSGAFGDEERILLQCPKCGQYIDGKKAMSHAEAMEWRKEEE